MKASDNLLAIALQYSGLSLLASGFAADDRAFIAWMSSSFACFRLKATPGWSLSASRSICALMVLDDNEQDLPMFLLS